MSTAWSKSSLPSDRIKPSSTRGAPNVAKPKGKSKQQQPVEPPKSKAVRKLEGLLADVNKATGEEKGPKGGCFCLARTHTLSPYTPLCMACGLILCSINLPQYCCPHCLSVLLTPTTREKLVDQFETELAETIAKEIADQERVVEEAQRAAGAFPMLAGSSTPLAIGQPRASAANPPPTRQTHKVISLTGSRRGGVLVSSYTTIPVPSRPSSQNYSPKEIEEEEVYRIPPPPPEPPHATRRPSTQRPWENLLDGSVGYQLPSRVDDVGSSAPSRRNRKGKSKTSAQLDGKDQ